MEILREPKQEALSINITIFLLSQDLQSLYRVKMQLVLMPEPNLRILVPLIRTLFKSPTQGTSNRIKSVLRPNKEKRKKRPSLSASIKTSNKPQLKPSKTNPKRK